MSGCLRYSRSSVKAAFFLTKDFEVLVDNDQQVLFNTGIPLAHTERLGACGPLH